MTILSNRVRTARKTHRCGAWYWFDRSGYGVQDIEPGDWITIEAVRADKGCITPGMQYIHQTGTDGGRFYDLKARQDMHDICLKYDLYPED